MKVVQAHRTIKTEYDLGILTVVYSNGEVWEKHDSYDAKWEKIELPYPEEKQI